VEFEGVQGERAGIRTFAKEWGKFWLYAAVLRMKRLRMKSFNGRLPGDALS
jgi:hypothetical protein